MEVQFLYVLLHLPQCIRLHVVNRGQNLAFATHSRSFDQVTCCGQRSKLCVCYSLSLNWSYYMLQMVVRFLYVLFPLAQLIRWHVGNGCPNLVCVIPAHSIDYIRCCTWKYKPCIYYSPSLNWLDYILWMRVYTPSRQFVRLYVVNGGLHLRCVNPSPSIVQIVCCDWRSTP